MKVTIIANTLIPVQGMKPTASIDVRFCRRRSATMLIRDKAAPTTAITDQI